MVYTSSVCSYVKYINMEDYHKHNIHTYILNCGVLYMGKFWQTIQVQAIGEEKFGE